MIVGDRIYIRAYEEEDVALKVKWMNDPKVIQMLNSPFPISKVATKKWLHNMYADSSRMEFIVCMKDTDEIIGYTGFRDVNYKNKNAESYTGIGNTDYWGKGLGKEIKVTVINYIFGVHDMNKIYTQVRVGHDRNLRLNESIGFVKEGVLRQHIYNRGQFKDVVVQGVLKEEFYKVNDIKPL